jgi:hypothetical protein
MVRANGGNFGNKGIHIVENAWQAQRKSIGNGVLCYYGVLVEVIVHICIYQTQDHGISLAVLFTIDTGRWTRCDFEEAIRPKETESSATP